MCFEWLCVIFFVMTVLNYIFLDIKVDKIKKERSLDRDKVMGSLTAHNSVLRKLNEGYKDHERRINDIENLLLSEKPEEPEEPDQLEYTCKDCKYYHDLPDNVNYFNCKGLDDFILKVCDMPCSLFEKKESLDEDENAVYANNVKIDISSKGERIHKTDIIFMTYGDYADYIRKLYLDGGISYADMNTLLERLKQ